MDKRDYADLFAEILREHEPCTDYDGCQCQHRTRRESGPVGYTSWATHVVAQFLYPEPSAGAVLMDPAAGDRAEEARALYTAAVGRERLAQQAELVSALHELGREYGALGVALAAARLTDPAVLIGHLDGTVTTVTTPSLTPDKTHLSEVRNPDADAEADTRPVGDSGADPVGPHIIVRPGDIWRIEMAAMLAAEGFTQSTGDIGDGFNPPGWVWEFTSASEYDGRTLTVVVDPASLIIQNMEINGTPVPMISLTLPHTKPSVFDDDANYARALSGALDQAAAVGLLGDADAGDSCPVVNAPGWPGPSITCPRCGRTSWNPNDVANKWCGNCSAYHPGAVPWSDVMAHTRPPVYGPHCSHADLCSMFGCDQRGHIDYPCREQATCEYCGPDTVCPSSPSGRSAAECPECHVAPDDPPGGD